MEIEDTLKIGGVMADLALVVGTAGFIGYQNARGIPVTEIQNWKALVARPAVVNSVAWTGICGYQMYDQSGEVDGAILGGVTGGILGLAVTGVLSGIGYGLGYLIGMEG
jgi:hypothetical protein